MCTLGVFIPNLAKGSHSSEFQHLMEIKTQLWKWLAEPMKLRSYQSLNWFTLFCLISASLLSPLYIVLPMELNLMSRGLNFVSKVTTGFLICRDVLSPWLVKMKCPQFILCLIKYPNAILIHGLGSLLRSSTLHFYIYMDSSRSEGGTFCWKKHM